MSNLEVVGSLLLYVEFTRRKGSAEAIRQAVIQAEAEGNVVVDVIPIYAGWNSGVDSMWATAVFLKVAGSTITLTRVILTHIRSITHTESAINCVLWSNRRP